MLTDLRGFQVLVGLLFGTGPNISVSLISISDKIHSDYIWVTFDSRFLSRQTSTLVSFRNKTVKFKVSKKKKGKWSA